MGHQHSASCSHKHEHGHHHHHAEGNILLAFVLNLFFCVVELIGGILTGSVAILSDALHDFGDALSLGLAWYLQRLSKRGRDRSFSYGYKRFSLLSSLIISSILLGGGIWMMIQAVTRLFSPVAPHAEGMFALALLGLAVNGFAAYRMHGTNSLSERAIRLHLLEDVLGWVAVLVVSIVMYFVHCPILDPLLSLGISLWLLYNVFFTLRDNLRILMQGVPEGVDTEAFVSEICTLKGVCEVHDLHVWTLNGEEHIASLHVVCCPKHFSALEATAELKEAIRHLGLNHQLNHLTIELELEGGNCPLKHC